MESSMAIVGGRETSSNLFFFFFSFWMIITKRKEGTGHSNVRTVVRGVAHRPLTLTSEADVDLQLLSLLENPVVNHSKALRKARLHRHNLFPNTSVAWRCSGLAYIECTYGTSIGVESYCKPAHSTSLLMAAMKSLGCKTFYRARMYFISHDATDRQ
ncbi:hypothetical protein F2P81_016319 [Scophthalmus maximus]|uniref:Uncharacterized protein n=1 Tax=Scophthalmus maximus TaxID=52904 RepID=A0A6A4SL73_SCOMX|nr:hypothetical protein F2P81_016319 [Scophthalmus maximus]